jgi:non-specific serine/threonine protein kinase
LRATRLLTLTGTGGVGKTRLAIQVAAELGGAYPDGTWLVELASLSDSSLVPQAVLGALGKREAPGESSIATLVGYLQSIEALIVLDNCEHLVDACAHLTDAILRSCPHVRVLATSREPLRIGAELIWRVPALTLPEDDTQPLGELSRSEAVRLFVERAEAIRSGFELTDTNAAAVAAICWRLDGIPLALELAAARVGALSPEQIAERLDDRFVLLTAGRRTAPPRQQTLRASLDWSHGLLTEAERTVFRRVAVFAGGFRFEAAEAVCCVAADDWVSFDAFAGLIDRSLVQVDYRDGEARYHLLETIRAYAWERLVEGGEVERIQRRHAEMYLALARRCEQGILQGIDQAKWLDQLELEHANLRAALAWSIRGDGEAGLRLVRSLTKFWQIRGHFTEGRRWLAAALAACPGRTKLRASALVAASVLTHAQGDPPAERRLLEESLAISRDLGDKQQAGEALLDLGRLARNGADHRQARDLLEESLTLFRETGDLRRAGWVLHNLAILATAQSDPERAKALFAESLAIARSLGDRSDIAWGLLFLGLHYLDSHDRDQAGPLVEQSLRTFQEIGDRQGAGWASRSLGRLALHDGKYPEAERLLRECLEQARALGEKKGVAWALIWQADLTRLQGNPSRAMPLLEESLGLMREIGDRSLVGLVLATLGAVARAAGSSERAKALSRESLREIRACGDQRAIAHCLWRAGTGALWDCDYVRGVRVIAAAEARPRFGRWRYAADDADAESSLASARSALGEEAFARAQGKGQAMTLEQAVAYALTGEPG